MLVFLVLGCGPNPTRDGATAPDTADTAAPPPTERVLPDSVAGLSGEESWAVTLDGVAWCSGVTTVLGAREDTLCPECDFAFRLSTELVDLSGDTTCDVATRYDWVNPSEVEPLALAHRPTDEWSTDEYEVWNTETWDLDYAAPESDWTYLELSGEITDVPWPYSPTIHARLGYDGDENVVWTDEGVEIRTEATDFVGGYLSDWWSYCADDVPWDGTSLLLDSTTAEGTLPVGQAEVGDVWSFPVTVGDEVRVSVDHRGWAVADLHLMLARPNDRCLAMEGGGNEPCFSAPDDSCAAITWTATDTGVVRIGVAAHGPTDVADYLLGIERNGEPVTPAALGDDVTLETEWVSQLDFVTTARLSWE